MAPPRAPGFWPNCNLKQQIKSIWPYRTLRCSLTVDSSTRRTGAEYGYCGGRRAVAARCSASARRLTHSARKLPPSRLLLPKSPQKGFGSSIRHRWAPNLMAKPSRLKSATRPERSALSRLGMSYASEIHPSTILLPGSACRSSTGPTMFSPGCRCSDWPSISQQHTSLAPK